MASIANAAGVSWMVPARICSRSPAFLSKQGWNMDLHVVGNRKGHPFSRPSALLPGSGRSVTLVAASLFSASVFSSNSSATA